MLISNSEAAQAGGGVHGQRGGGGRFFHISVAVVCFEAGKVFHGNNIAGS